MIGSLPPGTLMIVGALLVPLLPRRARAAGALALPLASLAHLLTFFGGPQGALVEIPLLGQTLVPLRVDRLSLLFALVFHIAAILGAIYALHVRDGLQHVAGLVYAGAAISAVFAGDLLTLFVYWELTAVASVFLVWASRTERAYRAGMRYLIIQVLSGVILLAGLILRFVDSGSLAFDRIGVASLGGKLIFVAFGIKAAFPLLHNWLQDAYPEATVTGTVLLSAFTTKLAIYTLARGFAGTHILIWIGVTMTVFPIFYAVIENNLRRVLAYSLNNQLGFMIVGIGVGTELALNGAVSHAFAHIIYKALLFMSMGAVLHRTGTIKASELGGLYRSMPWTTAFCIIGAASISAFPLFSGFVTKSMVLSATAEAHMALAYALLLLASTGVLEHSGIKIPFFAFFAHDSGIRCKEAPWNMLLAMGLAAFLCVFIGIVPGPLYSLLPYPVDYAAYTPTHVITMLQMLLCAALAFAVLLRTRLYPAETPSVNLDSDWVYRKLLPAGVHALARALDRARAIVVKSVISTAERLYARVYHSHGPEGVFARTWATGSSVLWVVVVLGCLLALYYL